MMTLTCTSYGDQQPIPLRHVHQSAKGENISPGFAWSGAPAETKSFMLFVYDPHPVAKNWVHWLVVDLSSSLRGIAEGTTGSLPHGARELRNTYGNERYDGPAPPVGSGRHPYVATVYALSTEHCEVTPPITLESVKAALKGKVLAEATMTGYYERR